jgi:hypothetical protein
MVNKDNNSSNLPICSIYLTWNTLRRNTYESISICMVLFYMPIRTFLYFYFKFEEQHHHLWEWFYFTKIAWLYCFKQMDHPHLQGEPIILYAGSICEVRSCPWAQEDTEFQHTSAWTINHPSFSHVFGSLLSFWPYLIYLQFSGVFKGWLFHVKIQIPFTHVTQSNFTL